MNIELSSQSVKTKIKHIYNSYNVNFNEYQLILAFKEIERNMLIGKFYNEAAYFNIHLDQKMCERVKMIWIMAMVHHVKNVYDFFLIKSFSF
jgi:hypothetical protein